MEPKEPKVRRLKGEDDEPKARKQKVETPAQDDEVEDQPVQAQQPAMAVKQDTIKIGKTDLHITYRDTTFFLLGLLCGVVL